MAYTYTGLKEWTGNYCNGVPLDNPDDFWNEHQFYYECTLNGRYYAFKPDLIGYADGRVSVQIIHPDFAEVIDLEFSPINEIWVEYIPGRGRDTHYICTSSVLPCILEPLLYAAVKRCRNYKPEYADFM